MWSPICISCHWNQRMQKIYLKVCYSTTFPSDFVFNYRLILIGAFFVFNIVLQVLSGTSGKNLDVLLLQPLHTQWYELGVYLSYQTEQKDCVWRAQYSIIIKIRILESEIITSQGFHWLKFNLIKWTWWMINQISSFCFWSGSSVFFFCVHVSYINSIGNKCLNVLEGGDIYNSTDQ
jgi:hypothetical protein